MYVKNGNNDLKLDKNGHFIVDHDLHNHDGELEDCIAEAFVEFAKSENFSFSQGELIMQFFNCKL